MAARSGNDRAAGRESTYEAAGAEYRPERQLDLLRRVALRAAESRSFDEALQAVLRILSEDPDCARVRAWRLQEAPERGPARRAWRSGEPQWVDDEGLFVPVTDGSETVAVLELALVAGVPRDPEVLATARAVAAILWSASERHRSRALEDRFRALVERSQTIYTILDERGHALYRSPGFDRTLGYGPEERERLAPLDLVHPDDRAPLEERLRGLAGSPERSTDLPEFRVRDAAGRWRRCVGRAVDLRDDPAVEGVLVHWEDVSERRVAQREARFRALLLDAVGEAVLAMDTDGRITFWNRTAERIFGWPEEEALGRDAAALTMVEPAEREPGEEWSGEARLRRASGGTFPGLVADAPLRDGHGETTGTVRICADLTEQKQMEHRVQRAQRMESIARLAGGVAHDFNNLLTAIGGFVQLASDRLEPDHGAREALEEATGAVERAGRLTRQLLAYSRQQILQPRRLDLGEAVAGMGPLLRRLAGDDVEVVIRVAEQTGFVRADPAQIDQVLVNLVVNARDAMPEGGRVEISTGFLQLDSVIEREEVVVEPGEYVTLTVRDTGVGMDAETRTRLFEPFYTTKQRGEGTGLGLSTVYGIVKQSGGYVWVYSEPGEGSVFRIYLPRAREGREAGEPVEPPPPPGPGAGGTETILVVEDDRAVRALAVRVLESLGYRVLEAADGREALESAARHEGSIDLVFTDVVMPGVRGPALVERLRRDGSSVAVLYTSGYAPGDGDGREVELPGPFVEKPYSPGQLARRVREALDGVG